MTPAYTQSSYGEEEAMLLLSIVAKRKRRRERRWCVHEIILMKIGEFQLSPRVRQFPEKFRQYFRMEPPKPQV
jgi:hypothetical protein